jgi:hypothetical protein
MPNTAIAYCESMTCLSAEKSDEAALAVAQKIFDGLGACVVVSEDQIVPATALCAWYVCCNSMRETRSLCLVVLRFFVEP